MKPWIKDRLKLLGAAILSFIFLILAGLAIEEGGLSQEDKKAIACQILPKCVIVQVQK